MRDTLLHKVYGIVRSHNVAAFFAAAVITNTRCLARVIV